MIAYGITREDTTVHLDLDIEQFWKDDAAAHRENCFFAGAPQMALGIRMSDECVFAELGEDGEPWGVTPRERRIELNKRYNEKAVKIVGRPLLREKYPTADMHFPAFRQIGEVFGGKYVFDGKTTWLNRGLFSVEELEKRLDYVDTLTGAAFRDFVLPENWDAEKNRLAEQYGLKPPLFRHIRGPVTLACSVFGTEDLIFLLVDEPELAERFSRSIARVVKEYIDLFDAEAGHTRETSPHGFSFADDDCCLLTPDMYEAFGFPILKEIFDYQSPNPGDPRFQHSDSAMAHQIPALSRLHLTGCNFGPTVLVDQIRKYMPDTRIDGCLAPFTFMKNDEEKIVAEVKRDAQMARESGVKGVNFSTAGSINNGSLLTSMRTVMAAIQTYGRY